MKGQDGDMKKFLRIISVILVLMLSVSMCSVAYADGTSVDMQGNNSWETEPFPFDGGDDSETTPGGSGDTSAKINISKCAVSGIKNKTYSGKKLTQSVTVKYNGKILKNKTDYKVSYKNNINVGTAKVVIEGVGDYEGSVTKSFKINPKGTSVSKLSKPKTKQIKVVWKKQAVKTTGYQIQIATNSKFTSNKKTYTVAKNTLTSKTIKSLKKNKKYYIRVRTYKSVNGAKYVSSWSAYKTITTK